MSSLASDEKKTPKRPRHRTVDRIAQLLELAARSEAGLTLTELAAAVEAPMSSIQALVNGLTAAGFLTENARRFHLGPAPYLLNAMAGRPLVRSVAHSALEALQRESGHAVVLSVMMGRSVYYVDAVGDLARFHYLADALVPRPPLRSSSGRAIAAHLDRRELWGLLQSLPSEDAGLVDDFLDEVSSIVQSGVAYGAGLTESGLHGIAVPVIDAGRVVAAVAVVGPSSEISRDRSRIERVLRHHREEWAT